MDESGTNRIEILGEMLEFVEHVLRKRALAKNSSATDLEIEAHIAEWYAASKALPEGVVPRVLKDNDSSGSDVA